MRAFRNMLVHALLIATVISASQAIHADIPGPSILSADGNCAAVDGDSSCYLDLVQAKAEALRNAHRTTNSAGVEGTCKIEGNPDTIIGFDAAKISWLQFFLSFFHLAREEGEAVSQDGDMWLVKSPSVQIQGRYNSYKKGRLLKGIAVSGQFIKDNVVRIGTLQQKILWNDEEILSEEKGSKFQVENITTAHRTVVEDVKTTMYQNGQHDEIVMKFGSDVTLVVSRRMNDLDISITMLQNEEGQDGQCGNFNGNRDDDTAELITGRLELQVPESMLLFTHGFGIKEADDTQSQEVGEVRPHAQLVARKAGALAPIDCDKHNLPVKALREGDSASGFNLKTLDVTTGNYNTLYPIPYSQASPAIKDISSCAVSPLTDVVYCCLSLPDKHEYLVRIDATQIEFVAKIPDSHEKYNAAAFGKNGNLHFSKMGTEHANLVSISGVDDLQGFADPKTPSLTDYSNLRTSAVTDVADWVAFEADLRGTGTATEWLLGMEKGTQMAILVDADSKEMMKLDTGVEDLDAAYSAGWNIQGRLFFASNNRDDVFEVKVASIDIDGKKLVLEKAAVSAATKNDCLTERECTIYGDPHVVGFDRAPAHLSFLGLDSASRDTMDDSDFGDRWLVRSSLVHIQGRYNLVDASSNKVFLKGLAVGGPFLQNNTLLVSSHDRKVFWNNEEILTELPSRYDNRLISASFYKDAMLVQDPSRRGRSPGIDVDLPLSVNLHITQGKNGLGVKISMPPVRGGQDGMCGNFNGIGDDDSAQLVSKRLGASIAPAELLFRRSFVAA